MNDMEDKTSNWKCYFIEHRETREWWAGEDENNNPAWTKDPMRASPFDYEYEASIRAWAYKLNDITEITEHIFIGSLPPKSQDNQKQNNSSDKPD